MQNALSHQISHIQQHLAMCKQKLRDFRSSVLDQKQHSVNGASCILFPYCQYPFLDKVKIKHGVFKTVVNCNISNAKLQKLIRIRHANIINLQKITRGHHKSKFNYQTGVFYSFYFQSVPYSLKKVMTVGDVNRNILFRLATLNFSKILRELNGFLMKEGIYNIFKLQDIGVTKQGQIKIYLSPLVVCGGASLKMGNHKAVTASINRLLGWWETSLSSHEGLRSLNGRMMLLQIPEDLASEESISNSVGNVEKKDKELAPNRGSNPFMRFSSPGQVDTVKTRLINDSKAPFRLNHMNAKKGQSFTNAQPVQHINYINIYNNRPTQPKLNYQPVSAVSFNKAPSPKKASLYEQGVESVDTYEMELNLPQIDIDEVGKKDCAAYASGKRELSQHSFGLRQEAKKYQINKGNQVFKKNAHQSAGPLQFKNIVNHLTNNLKQPTFDIQEDQIEQHSRNSKQKSPQISNNLPQDRYRHQETANRLLKNICLNKYRQDQKVTKEKTKILALLDKIKQFGSTLNQARTGSSIDFKVKRVVQKTKKAIAHINKTTKSRSGPLKL